MARVAKPVYMTNLLFSHYENKYVAAYLYGLDSSYKASSHSAFVGHLLDQCYEKVKGKVNARLCTPRFLNFHTDESNNIRKNRVINYLAHAPKGCGTEGGCFYIHSDSNDAKTMVSKLGYRSDDRNHRRKTMATVNSLTTDTCNLIRALWKILQKVVALNISFELRMIAMEFSY